MDLHGVGGLAGTITVRPAYGRAAVGRSEVLVVFDTREDRDFVKSSGYNLASEKDVGMAIHVPGHLLDNFHALNNIGYNIKQKNADVKRAIKFNDAVCDIFLDICVGGIWRRILPREAKAALKNLPAKINNGNTLEVSELISLAGGDGDQVADVVIVPADETESAGDK